MGKTSKIQENYAGKNSLRLQNEGSIARNLPGDAPQLRRRLFLRRRAAAIPCGGRPGGMCAGAENRLWIGAFTAGQQSAPTVQEVSPRRSKKRNPPQSAEKPGKAGGCGPLSTPGFFDRQRPAPVAPASCVIFKACRFLTPSPWRRFPPAALRRSPPGCWCPGRPPCGNGRRRGSARPPCRPEPACRGFSASAPPGS